MSNKAQKRGLVPKLRFPEFRGGGVWKGIKLSNLAQLVSGLHLSPDQYSKYGEIPYFTGPSDFTSEIQQVSKWTSESTNVAKENDTLITVKGSGVGEIWYLTLPSVAMGRQLMAVRAANSCGRFIYQFLLTKKTRFEDLASGNLIPGLSRGDVLDLEAYFPSIPEQQKIADCLASLDELIILEAQKLDTLKTHKKGLMQQLFPAEGETLPKLRFPEFRDAGEWEETRLGDIGSVRMCKRILKEQTSPRGDIPFYKIGTFGGTPDAYISREIFDSFRNSYPFPKNGAVLISAAGTIGRTVRYNGELAYFQDSNIVWLDNSEKLIADNFLFYLYQLIDWSPSVGAIQRLYNENILGAQVKFPSIPEQQKIADCLATLDDLITAQTQQLAALKTHKKGLMQQLFPVTNGVDE